MLVGVSKAPTPGGVHLSCGYAAVCGRSGGVPSEWAGKEADGDLTTEPKAGSATANVPFLRYFILSLVVVPYAAVLHAFTLLRHVALLE